MKLIAKQPCSFGGKKFFIGDEIPAGFVVNPVEQEKMGVLVRVAQEHPAPKSPIAILIHAEEGDMEFCPTPEGLQAIFDALTGTADEAKAIAAEMTDCEALILLHMADGRKSVKAAAEARGKEISKPDEEQEGSESVGDQ
jgi:hypothetical protein